MRQLLLATILSLIATVPAFACANDITLKGYEREFRSQYQTTPPAPSPAPDTSSREQTFLSNGLIGAVLVVGALALTLRRSPPV